MGATRMESGRGLTAPARQRRSNVAWQAGRASLAAVALLSTVLLQRTVPDEFRGRVFATELGLLTLTTSASTYLYGWLVDVGGFGLRPLTVLLGLSLAIPGAAWMLGRRLRRTDPGSAVTMGSTHG